MRGGGSTYPYKSARIEPSRSDHNSRARFSRSFSTRRTGISAKRRRRYRVSSRIADWKPSSGYRPAARRPLRGARVLWLFPPRHLNLSRRLREKAIYAMMTAGPRIISYRRSGLLWSVGAFALLTRFISDAWCRCWTKGLTTITLRIEPSVVNWPTPSKLRVIIAGNLNWGGLFSEPR